MKPSIYNLTTTNPHSGETILFNTLYGSTVAVDQTTLPMVTNLLNDTSSGYAKPSADILNSLKSGKFIIEDDVNELDIVKHRKTSGMKDLNRANVIIMPNMDCNFACPYCYEEHDHQKRMSQSTEASIKKWLGMLISNHKVILLNWFGGEPLLSHKPILSIGKFAIDKCNQHGVSLLTNITTNGYAFTESMIKQFVDIDLLSYQITVDGPPHIHNKTRVLKTGKGTFDRILGNIIKLAETSDKVKISLRVNFNHHNIEHIPELLTYFPDHIRSQLRIVYEPIFGDSKLSATTNLTNTKISHALTEYYELAETMGFDVVLGGLGVGKLVYCYAEREHQYIVNYNADVFKCSVSDFSSKNRAGFINEAGEFVRDTQNWNAWFSLELFEEECESCSFLPLCMGGCRKDRIENSRTGSYCHLIPTNTSNALKSIAFGNFQEILSWEVETSRNCANNRQSDD